MFQISPQGLKLFHLFLNKQMDHLPRRFLEAKPTEQEKIVSIGLDCWDLINSELDAHKDMDNSTLTTIYLEKGKVIGKKEQERESAHLLYEKDSALKDVQYKLSALEKKFSAVAQETEEKCQKEFEREKPILLREARSDVQKEIGDLKQQILELKMCQNYRLACEILEEKLQTEKATNEKLAQQITDLTQVRSSYAIGKEGEAEIEQILQNIDFDYENVHQDAEKADFRIKKESRVIILDSKKYKKNVPAKEREKIIRDTDKDATVCAGILISLNSKVATKSHCDIELTPNKKPILYLSVMGMTKDAKQAVIDSSLRFILKFVASNDEREKNDLLDKMKLALTLLDDLKKELENNKKIAGELLDSIKGSESKVKKIIEYLKI
jgi:hypothetical protein